MRKVDNGEKRKKCRSGHYVIASSLPPERRMLERRKLVPISTLAVPFVVFVFLMASLSLFKLCKWFK